MMNLLNKIADKFCNAEWDDLIMFFMATGIFVVIPVVGFICATIVEISK